MSRQSYFLQTEIDLIEFYSFIVSLDAIFLTIRGGVTEIHSAEELLPYAKRYCPAAIVPTEQFVRNREAWKDLKRLPVESGFYVEYLPCCIEEDTPHTFRWGRVYLHRDQETGEFRPETQALYNKIIRFIRKKYVYDKRVYSYLAPDFREQYINQEFRIW